MPDFRFCESSHTYTLNGVRLASVTEIIDGALNLYAGVPRELMERAQQFGRAVHKTVELYLLDDLDEPSLDDGLRGPLEAFKRWQDGYPHFCQGARIEQPGYHKRLKFAGTPDIEGCAVIDIKSRKVNMLADPMQCAGYDHMTGDGKRERYCLELRQDGKPIFTRLNPTKKSGDEAWSRFRFLHDLHNSKMEVERWKMQ